MSGALGYLSFFWGFIHHLTRSWQNPTRSCTSPPGCSNSRNPWYPPSPEFFDGRGRPALSQNPKLRRRAPPGVRRGHPHGRPGPTRRRLSALRGVLLPFAHGFRRQRPRSSQAHDFEGRPMPRSIFMLGLQRFFVKHLLSGRAGIKALRGGEYSLAGRAVPAITFQRYASAPGISHDGGATSVEDRFRS